MAGRNANGEGSIYQRKDKRWVAALTVREPSGASKSLRQYAKSKPEAKAKLKEMQRQAESGVRPGSGSQKVSEYLENFLERSVKMTVRPRTFDGYRSMARFRINPRIGGLKLTQVTSSVVEQLNADLLSSGLSPYSVRNVHRFLHRAFDSAVHHGLIVRNPCDGVRPPRAPREEVQSFTAQQLADLFVHSKDHRLGPLFVLAANTGMRLGELLGLQWSDINLTAKRLVVRRSLQRQQGKGLVFSEPKTGRSRRTIHLTDRAVAALRLQLERQREDRDIVGSDYDDRNLIFATPFGHPLDPGTTSNTFKRELVAAGLPPYKFHALRHTCATLLFEQGVNAKVISELLGHSTISITLDIYSHVTPTMHASAAPVMDDIFNRLEAA